MHTIESLILSNFVVPITGTIPAGCKYKKANNIWLTVALYFVESSSAVKSMRKFCSVFDEQMAVYLMIFHNEMINIVCPKVKTMELKQTAMKRLIFVIIFHHI